MVLTLGYLRWPLLHVKHVWPYTLDICAENYCMRRLYRLYIPIISALTIIACGACISLHFLYLFLILVHVKHVSHYAIDIRVDHSCMWDMYSPSSFFIFVLNIIACRSCIALHIRYLRWTLLHVDHVTQYTFNICVEHYCMFLHVSSYTFDICAEYHCMWDMFR